MPIANHDEVWVEIQGDIVEQDRSLKLGYAIYSPDGQLLYRSFDKDGPPEQWPRLTPGSCILRSRLPARLLNEGVYRIELIALLHPHDWLIEPGPQAPAVYLSILGGLSDSPFWLVKRPGLLAPVLQWMSHVEPAARQAS